MIKIAVYAHAHKGRDPATRWGRIRFDDAGYGFVEVQDDDLELATAQLKLLGWYLDPQPGTSQEVKANPEAPSISDDNAAMPLTEQAASMAAGVAEPSQEAPEAPVAAETATTDGTPAYEAPESTRSNRRRRS